MLPNITSREATGQNLDKNTRHSSLFPVNEPITDRHSHLLANTQTRWINSIWPHKLNL